MVCLSVYVSPLGAQTLEKAAVTLPQATLHAERQAVRGIGMLTRPPYLPQSFDPAILQQSLTITRAVSSHIVSPSAQAQVSAPSQVRYESPLRQFLPGKEENVRVNTFSPSSMPPGYAGRSLESLRMECESFGVSAENVQTYSRAELANLLFHYQAHATAGQTPSLFEKRAKNRTKKPTESDVKKWAREQPDFIASNYIDNDDVYMESFTGPATQLRILLVNDEWEEVELFRVAAWQDGNIMLDYAESVVDAMFNLKNRRGGYDIVLLDHDMEGGNGSILSMWMHEKKIRTPAVLYSRDYIAPEWLYKFNIKGRIEINQEPQAVLNFIRNIVTTGRAYPNGK